jgi:myosin heavy subunit
MSQVISRASKADQDYARGVENIYSNSLEDEFVGKINHQHFTNIAGEGLEVQDFFGNAVEGAKSEFSEADIAARAAAEVTTLALERLSEADHALTDAEARLEESYHLEKEKALEARRAANEARANREHADTARRRVETVKELLRNSKDRATSAEAVVVTAVTEAKISEQRAGEMEARASRALAIAEKERTRADVETRKEEVLEQEASELHDRSTQATKEAKAARDRMEKAASMLDKVNEQIKLIEQSTQFQKDMKEWDKTRDMDAFNSEAGFPKHGGNVLAKHAAKLQERQVCTEVLKEASVAYQSVDVRRKRIQTALEEKAHMWKMQSEIASQARKQADRSSQHAEELAEHAEEEREAASLRHIARERAQQSVSKTDNYQSSIQAQLIEASRASEEAASLALESRIKAEKLEREAEFFKDHSEAIKHVENMKKKWEEADAAYQAALKKKKTADEKAKNAKRLFDTSSEVLTRAQRDSANEINDANMRRQMEREAVQAYRNMIICQKLVSNASQKTKMAKDAALQKAAAERRAREYKIKMDSRGSVAPELARLTFLHSDKFQKWEKSHALPSFYLHSIAHVRVSQMLEKNGEKERDNFVAFTRNHLCRTFPSWRLVRERKEVNYDPTTAHALGCQLVSMNLHSSDEHLLVNDGRFRANGSCGYVLKPAELLEDVPQRAQTWRFTVLCGSCLPKSEVAMTRKSIPVPVGGSIHPISPFVRVALYDGAIGEEVILHETKPVHKNGFSPVWNDEEDEFDFKVTNPSIAVLLFTVWDDDTSDFVAGAAVPVDSIRQGYRSVSLFDSLHSRCGPYAYASIVVRAQQM